MCYDSRLQAHESAVDSFVAVIYQERAWARHAISDEAAIRTLSLFPEALPLAYTTTTITRAKGWHTESKPGQVILGLKDFVERGRKEASAHAWTKPWPVHEQPP